jgi:hypothetical protein
MILESYFDDSSDAKRAEYCAYGGLIGSAAQWDAQLIGWGNASHGLKKTFRSTECEGGHGQFEGVDKSERDARMARMIDVLHATELRGFASIVPVRTYRSNTLRGYPRNAYALYPLRPSGLFICRLRIW